MKRPGRPPLSPDEESVQVHFRLAVTDYDRTQKQADLARLSLAEYLRQVVGRAIRRDPR